MVQEEQSEGDVGSVTSTTERTFLRTGVMSEARDLVFFYNGVEMTDESVENVPAEFPLSVKGGTMRRGGKVWTVVDVRKAEPLSTGGNPVYRIFFSDGPYVGPKPFSKRH